MKGEERHHERQLGRLFEDRIGPKLRQYYAGVAQQPVPPRLLDLLCELEEKERRSLRDTD
jgi:hypothetical protein